MAYTTGKYERKSPEKSRLCPFVFVPLAFFLIELFAFCYLLPDAPEAGDFWPLLFGGFWSLILTGIAGILPRMAGRVFFGLAYLAAIVFSVGQTGYYRLFSEMMWLSEFRYASEGSDYFDILLSYPVSWFAWVIGLVVFGILLVWKYPKPVRGIPWKILLAVLSIAGAVGTFLAPQRVFENDRNIRYAGSDYGRMQSAEAAYENMFNPYRLYRVCGVYQMLAKDIYTHSIYPITPDYAAAQAEGKETVDAYFAGKEEPLPNAMTGLLEGKNLVLVLMESMDDWMLGDHTPTINRLMEEGICFTNFYTPAYGGIRTFNTEFCINTGSFLSSAGGYAFDYVTNTYNQSLASLLTGEGYSAKTFHYNTPSFYSRDVFSEAMGYDDYVYYADYLTEYTEAEKKDLLFDDRCLFMDPELRQEFFREEEKTLNFIITRSAHLSYRYNEILSHWGLKKYPEYRGMTENEETDCALLKARLVDDMFQWLMMELEEEGKLEDTVIIGVTDHYTYGYKNEPELLKLSGVESKLLLEKTPCFIWSAGMEPMEVDKVLNTSDLLPTVLNLLGVESSYDYIGRDAFDDRYDGFVPFSDGSWITSSHAYDATRKRILPLTDTAGEMTKEDIERMSDMVEDFTKTNNLILETDYYE